MFSDVIAMFCLHQTRKLQSQSCTRCTITYSQMHSVQTTIGNVNTAGFPFKTTPPHSSRKTDSLAGKCGY